MNLSSLERMVREGDLSLAALRYLLECRTECEVLDYKETLRLDLEKELCGFAKDILAMKNIGGGFIVVGVKDKTWAPVGLREPLPYDLKLLRDKLRRATALELDVNIVHHTVQVSDEPRLFGLVYVRGPKKRTKRRAPTMLGKDFAPRESYGLRRGDIFLRRGDSSVKVQSQEELEDLLDLFEARSYETSITDADNSSPFAVLDGTYRLLEKGFDSFIGRDELRERVVGAVTKDPRIWIINVHGPGGVGKSALVNWSAYHFYEERTFEAILHLTAKETVLTQAGIQAAARSLYSLENLLDHILLTFEEAPPADLESKRKTAVEMLSAWSTLLVLDNMETVSDGRIVEFLQSLPPGTQAKVLLTSRQKTGGWELPLPVTELTEEEVAKFLATKSREMGVDFPLDEEIPYRVWEASGGLPLAIQWIIGQYKRLGRIKPVLSSVGRKDSPVLEFSFRNIWNVLSPDAKAILALMTIFDTPPTAQDICIATEWNSDPVERALSELADVTLVTRTIQSSDGRVVYTALPITLSFARHQLATMGDLEVRSRQRIQRFSEQTELRDAEVHSFQNLFARYGLESENEKRAAILCRRGESEAFFGRLEAAEALFQQARELAPQCAYVHAMNASLELSQGHLGTALQYANEACRRANAKTGALAYTIKGRIHDAEHDKNGRVEALSRALEFEPADPVLRHQFGVALSRAGQTQEAIDQFTRIIDSLKDRKPVSETLLMSLKTRIINYQRMKMAPEAASDLAYAKRLMSENRHLQSQAVHFFELEE